MTDSSSHEPGTEPETSGTSTPPASPRGRGRRAGKAAAWIAVGAVGATVLSGVAFAGSRTEGAAGSSATTPSAGGAAAPSAGSADTDRRPGGPGRGGPGGIGGGQIGRGADVLHGELVVKDGDATKTVLTQNGTITAASSTSLTVKSSDGFTATWKLSTDTKVHTFKSRGADAKVSDLKVGDEVSVGGTKTSATSGDANRVGVRPTAAQLAEMKHSMPKRNA